jgi:hypothetical protein
LSVLFHHREHDHQDCDRGDHADNSDGITGRKLSSCPITFTNIVLGYDRHCEDADKDDYVHDHICGCYVSALTEVAYPLQGLTAMTGSRAPHEQSQSLPPIPLSFADQRILIDRNAFLSRRITMTERLIRSPTGSYSTLRSFPTLLLTQNAVNSSKAAT